MRTYGFLAWVTIASTSSTLRSLRRRFWYLRLGLRSSVLCRLSSPSGLPSTLWEALDHFSPHRRLLPNRLPECCACPMASPDYAGSKGLSNSALARLAARSAIRCLIFVHDLAHFSSSACASWYSASVRGWCCLLKSLGSNMGAGRTSYVLPQTYYVLPQTYYVLSGPKCLARREITGAAP